MIHTYLTIFFHKCYNEIVPPPPSFSPKRNGLCPNPRRGDYPGCLYRHPFFIKRIKRVAFRTA